MALVTSDTIKEMLLQRPYLVSSQTTDRDVVAAFYDIMFAYVNQILPNYNEDDYEVYDESEYNAAVCDLTFARLCYGDVSKAGYAVVRARHDNTSQATNQEQRKTARIYRRIGVRRLELLRALNQLDEDYTTIPVLGEEI